MPLAKESMQLGLGLLENASDPDLRRCVWVWLFTPSPLTLTCFGANDMGDCTCLSLSFWLLSLVESYVLTSFIQCDIYVTSCLILCFYSLRLYEYAVIKNIYILSFLLLHIPYYVYLLCLHILRSQDASPKHIYYAKELYLVLYYVWYYI